jgi:hypothetical protein
LNVPDPFPFPLGLWAAQARRHLRAAGLPAPARPAAAAACAACALPQDGFFQCSTLWSIAACVPRPVGSRSSATSCNDMVNARIDPKCWVYTCLKTKVFFFFLFFFFFFFLIDFVHPPPVLGCLPPPSARQLRAREVRLGRTVAQFPGDWRNGRRRVACSRRDICWRVACCRCLQINQNQNGSAREKSKETKNNKTNTKQNQKTGSMRQPFEFRLLLLFFFYFVNPTRA